MQSKKKQRLLFIFYFIYFKLKLNNNYSVNDNDDLTPLFNSYTDLLKLTYGDFYIAEMIEAQNENNLCLTAEVFKKFLVLCSFLVF